MFNGDFANYPDVIAIAIEKYGAPDVKKVEEYYPESEVSSTGFKPKHKGKPYGRTFLKWQSTQASMSVDLKSEKGSETLMMEYMYIPIIAKLKSDSVVALQNANKKLKQNKKNRTNEL